MPEKNGLETTEEILSLLKENDLKTFVCACSAFDGVDEKIKAEEAGMLEFLSKPLCKSQLEFVIKSVLFDQL